MTIFRTSIILLGSLLLVQPVTANPVLLDSVAVIVDEDIITERELDNRIKLVKIDFERSKRRLPKSDVMKRQVLEALIIDSLLLQEASRRGIKITDSQLNQTMQRLARQSNLSLSDYRRSLIAEGLNYDKYRESVRRRSIITALRRQYSQAYATVSEVEVDDFIRLSGAQEANYEYRLSHILIALPDAATPDQINAARDTGEEILAELDRGTEFDLLANTYSADENALQGGDLGWRKRAEIPSLFTAQVLSMEPGDYAGPLRSPSGFHVVYLKERRDLEQAISQQTRSRHILIKPNELISEDEARTRLLEFRFRILDGEDFAKLARLYSVDYTSGSNGGDIGWMNPGATVREYEEAANQLEEGELSEPVRTQFGWHLIEVTGRRTIDETEQNKREKVYSQLLQQKQQEVFDLWKRSLRDEAYIVFPSKPDA